MNAKAKGSAAERRVKKAYEDAGWLVTKSGGSLGSADLVALRAGCRPRLLQVKANAGGPFKNFGPLERALLLRDARSAGADVALVHVESRKPPREWWPDEWPATPLDPQGV